MSSKEQPGYAERDDQPTTEPTGGDPEVLEEHPPAQGDDTPPAAAPAPDEGQDP
jgi:hypothetical protein